MLRAARGGDDDDGASLGGLMDTVDTGRTWLFVPGHRPDRFGKAEAAGADVVIVDLEDAVAPDAKADARAHVVDWLAAGHRAAVRINAVGTPWHGDDLAALGARPPLAVVLPKAEDPDTVAAVGRAVGVPIVSIVESARGVLNVAALAQVTGQARLAFGTQDFGLELGIDPDDEAALATARGLLVLASRAAGLPGPLDGPLRTWDRPEVVRERAARAARLGFAGALCIHPAQVAPAGEGFAPPADLVAWAEAVVAAGDGDGVSRVDGEMVDKPVLDRARRILRDAGRGTP